MTVRLLSMNLILLHKPYSRLLAPGLPLSPEADPEGKHNQANIKPEGLLTDVDEIIAELSA